MEIKIWSPYLLQIHLVDSCIMDCDYCYLGQKTGKFIPSDKFIEFFDNLIKQTEELWLIFEVSLTGWDLWLYEKYDSLEEIFQYCASQKAIGKVNLLLNNLWYTGCEKYFEILWDKVRSVQLNTDIIEQRPQDVEYLVNKWYKVYFKVMLSRNSDAFWQIKIIQEIFQEFPDYEDLYISIDRLCPTSLVQRELLLEQNELLKILDHIKSLFWERFVTEDPFVKSYMTSDFYEENAIFWCAIPFGWLTIFPDKSIKLCARSFYIPTWYDMDNFIFIEYLENKAVDRGENTECKSCSRFRTCQWGCPATRFITSKADFLKKDIQCFLTPKNNMKPNNSPNDLDHVTKITTSEQEYPDKVNGILSHKELPYIHYSQHTAIGCGISSFLMALSGLKSWYVPNETDEKHWIANLRRMRGAVPIFEIIKLIDLHHIKMDVFFENYMERLDENDGLVSNYYKAVDYMTKKWVMRYKEGVKIDIPLIISELNKWKYVLINGTINGWIRHMRTCVWYRWNKLLIADPLRDESIEYDEDDFLRNCSPPYGKWIASLSL